MSKQEKTNEVDSSPRRVRRIFPDVARQQARALSEWSLAHALWHAAKEAQGVARFRSKVVAFQAFEKAFKRQAAEVRLARVAQEIRARQKALGQRDWIGHAR